MDDYSGTFAGLSIAAAVAALVGAGALAVAPGFGRWLTQKVAGFFASEEDDPDEDDGETTPVPCEGGCGDEFMPEDLDEMGYCSGCCRHWEN